MNKLKAIEIAKFGVFGAIMYASKVVMASLPNIHLIAVFIAVLTLVYGVKALYPIYLYIILEGLFGGFTVWWIPYLYIWGILWLVFMILPKRIPEKIKPVIYMIIVGLHGLLYGTLWAPAEKILLGMTWAETFSWVAAGFSYDIIHGVSNFCLGALIVPLTKVLTKLENSIS